MNEMTLGRRDDVETSFALRRREVSTSQVDECSGLAASRKNHDLYWVPGRDRPRGLEAGGMVHRIPVVTTEEEGISLFVIICLQFFFDIYRFTSMLFSF